MFLELMPLLAKRTLVLTMAGDGETQIVVNVIPKKSGDKDENGAGCTPLTLTGTPEELDKELPGVLKNYVELLGTFSHNIADVKTRLDEAVKAAQEEGKKKTEDARKTAGLKKSTPAPAAAEPPAPRPDLFSSSMPPAAPAAAPAPAAAEPKPIRRRTTATPKPAPAPEPESMELDPPDPIPATGLDPEPEPLPALEIEDDPDSCPF